MNLKTKFFHVTAPKPRRCTLAVSVPDKEFLLSLLTKHLVNCELADFTGTLGVSLVHPKDRYNHKTGRQTAVFKQEAAYFYLHTVERFKGGTLFKFQVMNLAKNVLKCQVNFFIQPDKQVVHIQFVDVSPIKRR